MQENRTSDEYAAWLRLMLEPGLGPATARQLLAAFGLPPDILSQSPATLMRHLPSSQAVQLAQPAEADVQTQIEHSLKWLAQPGHHLVTLADPDYPTLLLETADPPLALFVNGRKEMLTRPALGIVGARSATPGGKDNARAFARHLAERGWCVVSGLASGIDAAAHEGALEAGPDGGGTLAIMATGIDLVYPAANRALAHHIAQNGALISEFPLGTRAREYQFPKRNRIVAGMARGVLVVEAARQSGSLITARLASELGREVFAIPGSIHSPLSRGCHALIRQGAKLVESGQDILEELGAFTPRHGTLPFEQATDAKSAVTRPILVATRQTEAHARHPQVLVALGHDPLDLDTLQRRTGLNTADLSIALTELELDGRIAVLPDGRFQRLDTN
jgi:DNA processing protein